MITFKILDKKPIIENIDDAEEGKKTIINGYKYQIELSVDEEKLIFECEGTIHLSDIEKVAGIFRKNIDK